MILAIGFFVWSVSCSILGCYVANQKNRQAFEGVCIGFVFGIFGVMVVASLPTLSPEVIEPMRSDDWLTWIVFVIIVAAFIALGLFLAF